MAWDETGHITPNHSATSIRKECEASLRRLQVETIDLYQIHWPPADNGRGLEEAWSTLMALQKEGKARWIGVSNFDAAQLERAERIAPVTSLQPPYSILRRQIEEKTLPYCEKHNIGVIVYSPMFSGLLSGCSGVGTIPPGGGGVGDDGGKGAEASAEEGLAGSLGFGWAQGGRSGLAWAIAIPIAQKAAIKAAAAAKVRGDG